MNLTFIKKIIITITFLSITVGAIIGIVIIPTMRRIKQIDQQTYELRVYLEKKYLRTTTVRSVLKQIEKIKPFAMLFPEHIFANGQELQFITLLETVAAKNNIVYKINSSNLDVVNKNNLTVSLTATGSYYDVLRYLSELENTEYFITIPRLFISSNFERNQTTSSNNQITMDFELNLYAIH